MRLCWCCLLQEDVADAAAAVRECRRQAESGERASERVRVRVRVRGGRGVRMHEEPPRDWRSSTVKATRFARTLFSLCGHFMLSIPLPCAPPDWGSCRQGTAGSIKSCFWVVGFSLVSNTNSWCVYQRHTMFGVLWARTMRYRRNRKKTPANHTKKDVRDW